MKEDKKNPPEVLPNKYSKQTARAAYFFKLPFQTSIILLNKARKVKKPILLFAFEKHFFRFRGQPFLVTFKQGAPVGLRDPRAPSRPWAQCHYFRQCSAKWRFS
jgi:hypothetical protein